MLPGARGEQSDGSNPSHQRRGFDLAEKSLILGHQWCHHLYRRAKRSKPGLLLLGSIICGGQKKVWSFIWYQPSRISLCCLFLKQSQEDLLSQKGQHQWNANLAKSERGDSVRPGVDRLRARRKQKQNRTWFFRHFCSPMSYVVRPSGCWVKMWDYSSMMVCLIDMIQLIHKF